MMHDMMPIADYLIRMQDGTIKQVNPFTGTEVWTVPGRGHRPLGDDGKSGVPLDPGKHGLHCAFCHGRTFETPPEKARLVRAHAGWETRKGLKAERLSDADWAFRRVPNLFEIVSFEYWQQNYRYTLPPALQTRKDSYLATEPGRRHVLDVIDVRMRLCGARRGGGPGDAGRGEAQDGQRFFRRRPRAHHRAPAFRRRGHARQSSSLRPAR